MADFSSESNPGIYQVMTNGKTVDVAADRYSYGGDTGNLQLWDGAKIVAEFRWWDAITIKPE